MSGAKDNIMLTPSHSEDYNNEFGPTTKKIDEERE